ncbi:inositol-1-monophosphatase SuhB [Mycobacterium xenopi 4042]|uniref:Inositol-1-monophosphatase SuhB n=1 Tax=Mycobacterium xenopi 4042 TaxID=1299334 RepID=X8CED1_MYCXE|nr:inositol-1-monophosphatase SuhB [Mycobacterium xenopi 4042]
MLDPIDGTVNFVYGIPAYAVSVAAQVDGVSVAGAVADVAAGRVYSAAPARGTRHRRTGDPPAALHGGRGPVVGVAWHRIRVLQAAPRCAGGAVGPDAADRS